MAKQRQIIIISVIAVLIVAIVIGINVFKPAAQTSTNQATSTQTSTSAVSVSNKTAVEITKPNIDLDSYSPSSALQITTAGTYTLTGTLTDGIIEINGTDDDKFELILNNAYISNTDGPGIYTANADRTTITLANNTQNSITDGASYASLDASGNPDAAIFSHDDMTFKGNGSLTITGRYQDAIGGNDDLTISGGSYIINAADDAIHCGKNLTISAGNIDIQSSYEGIEGVLVTISGGDINIVASDDGINGAGGDTATSTNSATTPTIPGQGTAPRGGAGGMSTTTGEVIISGGTINIAAGGSGAGDGIDVNGNLTISGGQLVIKDPARYMDYEPLDFDGTFKFTGGRVQRLSASGVYSEITSSYTSAMGGRR